MPGMRMSISTTSGWCSATAVRDLAAVRGLADDLDVVGAGEQHRQAGADERVVVDDQDADLVAHCGHGSQARSRKSPCSSSPCSSRPPESVARSARPTSPVPEPGIPVAPAARTGTGLRTSIVSPSPGAPSTRRSTGGRRRVLARVGQRLLDDPQRVAADRVGDGGQVGDAHVGVEVHPGGARLLEQRRAARRASAGAAAAARRRSPSRSTPITARRSSSAWWALARITAGGARDLLRRRVRAELERAGVQAQQRDPVGEHVVHLARDPRPLGVAGLLDAQLLLGLGAAQALALAPGGGRGGACPRRRRPPCPACRRSSTPASELPCGVHGPADRQQRELQRRRRARASCQRR